MCGCLFIFDLILSLKVYVLSYLYAVMSMNKNDYSHWVILFPEFKFSKDEITELESGGIALSFDFVTCCE